MSDDALKEAQDCYREALDATRDQRRQIEEDLRFSNPSAPEQWGEQEKLTRESDPGGARPCLVLDQTNQYVQQIAGLIKQSPPSIHVLPASDGADQKVAEQLDGVFRHIEYASRAHQHYSRALTSAARTGVGYLVIRPEYTDRAMGYQEPRISAVGDPLTVVFDPWSEEIDGSDATFGFLLTSFSPREFERNFGKKAEKVSFGDSERAKSDPRESITVAEQWRAEDRTTVMVLCHTPTGEQISLTEDDFELALQNAQPLTVVHTYTGKYRCVKWSRMSGADILVPETEYPSEYIGLVPVYGYLGWGDNGRMSYCGIPRRARTAQQCFNFHASEARAFLVQAPKSPWVGGMRAFQGVEELWNRASIDSRAFLPYNDVDDMGAAVPPPFRAPQATNLTNFIQGMQQAHADIQASIGMYQANLGAPSNETSGVAIENRRNQGEAATTNFPGHLSASVAQAGKIVLQMIPRLVDTRRTMRILGVDNTPGSVNVNPQQTQPLTETPAGVSINPNVGQYDVRVVTGSSFTTQRQQAQQALAEVMRNNPALTPAIAPLWAQSLDVPLADKLAQVLTAIAPPPVKAVLQPQGIDTGPGQAELVAQNAQLKQALQTAIEHAHTAQQDADEAHQKLEEKAAETALTARELDIKAYDAETKRIAALGPDVNQPDIQAMVEQSLQALLLSQPQLPDSLQLQAALQEAVAHAQDAQTDADAAHEQLDALSTSPQELPQENLQENP